MVPCDELDGPTILLKNGRFGRIQSAEMWHRVGDELQAIWDNGELMIGYGEFAENNKPLVPSGYVSDWFASDLLESLDSEEKVANFAKILGVNRRRLPPSIPATGQVESSESSLDHHRNQRQWHRTLSRMVLDWDTVVEISQKF